jgi:hypothetical protein
VEFPVADIKDLYTGPDRSSSSLSDSGSSDSLAHQTGPRLRLVGTLGSILPERRG